MTTAPPPPAWATADELWVDYAEAWKLDPDSHDERVHFDEWLLATVAAGAWDVRPDDDEPRYNLKPGGMDIVRRVVDEFKKGQEEN